MINDLTMKINPVTETDEPVDVYDNPCGSCAKIHLCNIQEDGCTFEEDTTSMRDSEMDEFVESIIKEYDL